MCKNSHHIRKGQEVRMRSVLQDSFGSNSSPWHLTAHSYVFAELCSRSSDELFASPTLHICSPLGQSSRHCSQSECDKHFLVSSQKLKLHKERIKMNEIGPKFVIYLYDFPSAHLVPLSPSETRLTVGRPRQKPSQQIVSGLQVS